MTHDYANPQLTKTQQAAVDSHARQKGSRPGPNPVGWVSPVSVWLGDNRMKRMARIMEELGINRSLLIRLAFDYWIGEQGSRSYVRTTAADRDETGRP